MKLFRHSFLMFICCSLLFLSCFFHSAHASCSDKLSCKSCTGDIKCVWCTQHNSTTMSNFATCVDGDLMGPHQNDLKCSKYNWETCKFASNSLNHSQSYIVAIVLAIVVFILLIIFIVVIVIVSKRNCKCCKRQPRKKKKPAPKKDDPPPKYASVRIKTDEEEIHRTMLRNCVDRMTVSPSSQPIMLESPSNQSITTEEEPSSPSSSHAIVLTKQDKPKEEIQPDTPPRVELEKKPIKEKKQKKEVEEVEVNIIEEQPAASGDVALDVLDTTGVPDDLDDVLNRLAAEVDLNK